MTSHPLPAPAAVLSGVLAALLSAGSPAAERGLLDDVQVTATRIPERLERLPASLTIIHGEELRARGAKDLRSALALVAGVDAPPGGDAGPASSVPSLWGLHEFDAFLLVVDGVPWGGAFNPALPMLNLVDVERIEVLKGAAPVMYGATSFVGVIQVIRYPAGSASNELQLSAYNRSGASAALTTVLPAVGDYRQSLVVDGVHERLSGRDQGIDRGHVLYRGAAPLAGGNAGLDAEYSGQMQLPTSPVIRGPGGLTRLTPLDANFNPADAGIGEHRARVSLSYLLPTAAGDWHTLLSWTRSNVHDVRGFVRPELAIGDDGNNSDGFNQQRRIDDAYFDTGLATTLSPALTLTTGLDWLYGHGTQSSQNFAYVAALDGSAVPAGSGTHHIDEVNGLDNRRNLAGLYAQLGWHPVGPWALSAGLRLNHTSERQLSTHLDTLDASNNLSALDNASHTRAGGAVGASLRLWGAEGADERGTLYADYRNTFKPAAIDFGPDVTPNILKSEAATSGEFGLRGLTLAGRLEWELALFSLDFKNLVVHQTAPDGSPVLANAGAERLRGVEAELRWRLADGLTLRAGAAYHEATFGDTVTVEDGQNTQLSGRQLELSPHTLASLGLVYAPAAGVSAAVEYAYVGRRFLDRLNTTPLGGYATLDAHLGYRLARVELALDAYNLSDRRDPVTGSEFGDQSYYLLSARQLRLSLNYRL